MKKLFTMIALAIGMLATAQAPKLMNYQAVARNAQGQALANQSIKVRLTLQIGTVLPIPFYTETRAVTTNALGLFNVQVGSAGAQNVTGAVNGTNWLDGNPRYMKVEIDVANNGSFVDMGTQQLVSVPYALAAESANRVSAPFIGFLANVHDVYTPVYTNSVHKVLFNYESFDSSSVYNPTTGEFTAPEDGMYYMSATVTFNITTQNYNDRMWMWFRSNIRGTIGNSNSVFIDGPAKTGINHNGEQLVIFLSKNEKISFEISGLQYGISIMPFGTQFQVYKLH